MKPVVALLSLLYFLNLPQALNAQDTTYAERLGFPRGAKVVILHVDDAGMSWDSNEGAIEAMTKGVANSCSVMMTCPWVPGFVHFLQQHPGIDAGLHLTLTSEWKDYRWPPLSGIQQVPGLVDPEGVLWSSVDSVVRHASADEVETEIRQQIKRALQMGFKPTHLDSHMGTLFASPAFLQRYIKVGIDYQIPVMFPGGHASLIQEQNRIPEPFAQTFRVLGRQLWQAGLPVLDDLHNRSYEWKLPAGIESTDKNWQAFKTSEYISALQLIKPGLTMMIMHCSRPSEVFSYITDSGPTRKGDLLAMLDPALKKALADQQIILTTWREVHERRKQLASRK